MFSVSLRSSMIETCLKWSVLATYDVMYMEYLLNLREKSISVEGNRSASETFRSIEEEVSRAALAAHFGKRKIWTLKKARAK